MRRISSLALLLCACSAEATPRPRASEPPPPPSAEPAAPIEGASNAPVAASDRSPAPTPSPAEQPALPHDPPPGADPPPGCGDLQSLVKDCNTKVRQITVLTPNAEETEAKIYDDTSAKIALLSLEGQQQLDADAYRKALAQRAATTRALGKLMKSGKLNPTTGEAASKRLQEADAAKLEAEQTIAEHCAR